MRPLQAFLFWFLFLFEKREQKVHKGGEGQGEGRGGKGKNLFLPALSPSPILTRQPLPWNYFLTRPNSRPVELIAQQNTPALQAIFLALSPNSQSIYFPYLKQLASSIPAASVSSVVSLYSSDIASLLLVTSS